MTDSLYGDSGFYRSAGVPSRHFRTAAHTGSTWADVVATLAAQVDDALGTPDEFAVVDVGAGGGELLAELAATAPERWSLVGVDVADRPEGLPVRVDWQRQFPDSVHGIVIAVELLDVVPVDVIELADDGPHIVEVDEEGAERLAGPCDLGDRDWIARWWPLRSPGDRAEVGRPRDEMWRAITSRVTSGLALAVDYAADPSDHLAGTLTGYRNGRRRTPVPDGSMDLTAHVLFESLRTGGDLLLAQREALRRLGVSTRPPDYDDDPEAFLLQLARTSEAAELLNPHGLGAFAWLLHPVGIDGLLTS